MNGLEFTIIASTTWENAIAAIKILGIGMLVVIMVLMFISLYLCLMQFLMRRYERRHSLKLPVESITESKDKAIPLEVVAAISAAVVTVLDPKYRIKKIQYRSAPAEPGWSKQGISSIMASHATRRGYGK